MIRCYAILPQLFNNNPDELKTISDIQNQLTKRGVYDNSDPDLERFRIKAFLLWWIDAFHLSYYIIEFFATLWALLIILLVFKDFYSVFQLVFSFIENGFAFVVLDAWSEG